MEVRHSVTARPRNIESGRCKPPQPHIRESGVAAQLRSKLLPCKVTHVKERRLYDYTACTTHHTMADDKKRKRTSGGDKPSKKLATGDINVTFADAQGELLPVIGMRQKHISNPDMA